MENNQMDELREMVQGIAWPTTQQRRMEEVLAEMEKLRDQAKEKLDGLKKLEAGLASKEAVLQLAENELRERQRSGNPTTAWMEQFLDAKLDKKLDDKFKEITEKLDAIAARIDLSGLPSTPSQPPAATTPAVASSTAASIPTTSATSIPTDSAASTSATTPAVVRSTAATFASSTTTVATPAGKQHADVEVTHDALIKAKDEAVAKHYALREEELRWQAEIDQARSEAASPATGEVIPEALHNSLRRAGQRQELWSLWILCDEFGDEMINELSEVFDDFDPDLLNESLEEYAEASLELARARS